MSWKSFEALLKVLLLKNICCERKL